MAKKVIKESDFGSVTIKECHKKCTLNYTDIISNNNKYYTAEVLETDKGWVIYTQYGRVGGTAAKEYRLCNDRFDAESEVEKIIKSKIKKGYVEVKLIKADVGSELAKSRVESSNIDENTAKKLGYKIIEDKKSTLNINIQNLVKTWFVSVEKFIVDTLDTSKCSLGQLSIEQINKGRDILLDLRKIVSTSSKDLTELNNLSSKYYSTIPMNFGYAKLNADVLRFDNNDKLDRAFEILDTLEGAKGAEKILNKKNAIDEQYKSLKTDIEWVDPNDPIWKWIDLLFHNTRASNHSFLGKMKIHNIFKLKRDSEYNDYMNKAEQIAGMKGQLRVEVPDMLKPIWNKRIKEDSAYEKLYDAANITPLFHGTRTENMIKILPTKLLMRKPGFTVAGAMYDKCGGIYFGFSSKACNYTSTKGSYWANGTSNRGYMFLTDVALGKQRVAAGAFPYTLEGIKPCMSVWAKGGYSGVVNDEFIVYTENQNWLKYIIEFETKCL